MTNPRVIFPLMGCGFRPWVSLFVCEFSLSLGLTCGTYLWLVMLMKNCPDKPFKSTETRNFEENLTGQSMDQPMFRACKTTDRRRPPSILAPDF